MALKRAIDVVRRSRLDSCLIEIAPEGTITIVVGPPEERGARRRRPRA